MPDSASPRLERLAEAVADGQPPQWKTADSAATPEERDALRGLQDIAQVADLFAGLSTEESAVASFPPPTAAPGSAAPPLTWGPLEVRELVGKGRFGSVYRAFDPSLDREVALKLLRQPDRGSGDESQLVGEGRLMARVRHPNVVTIFGAQRIDGRTGLWMEFVHGRTLAAEVAGRGPFPTDEIRSIGIDLCRALAAVHAAGLVHRDVKAQNVLRAADGRVLLGDFGTGLDLDDGGTTAGVAGTPVYLAPEVLARRHATPQSDLYSLGVLLFHLATGRFPVEGRSLAGIKAAHAAGERISLRALVPDLASALVQAIERALEPDPAARFASAREMEAALGALRTPPHSADAGRRRAAYLAAGVLGIAATTTMLWTGGLPDSAPASPDPNQTGLVLAPGAQTRTFRQISNDPNLTDNGTPSPDGRLLSHGDPDTGEVAVYELATGQEWLVTGVELTRDPPGYTSGSRFSADGSLTYLRYVASGGPAIPEIRTVSITGGPSRLVWRGEDDREVWLQHWAGSGEILAARQMAPGQAELLVISSVTGHVIASLPVPAVGLTGASLSPDGRWVAYEKLDPVTGFSDIYVASVAGGFEAPVVEDALAEDGSPVWTPNGTHLLFLSDRSGQTSGLWAQSVVDGRSVGRPVRLEPNIGWAYPIGGLTDPGTLFIRRQIGTRDVHVVDMDPITLDILTEPKRVSAEGVGANGSSDWSPDGARLAFFRRYRERHWSLVVASLIDGTEQVYRWPDVAGIQRPRWEAQGHSLLFKANRDGRDGIHRLNLGSGELTTVMSGFLNEYEVLPEPDTILYSVRGDRTVYRRQLTSGREVVVHRLEAPRTLVELALSTRGDRFAYSAPGGNDTSLRVVDLAAPGQFRELLRVPETMSAYAWSVDDREIIIRRAPNRRVPDVTPQLWAVDARTGNARPLTLTAPIALQLVRRSQDGRHLSFDMGFPSQEVWALENALSGLTP